MASIIRVGQSQFASNPIDEDSYDRIMSCLHILEQLSTNYSIKSVFLHDTRAAFARIVEAEEVFDIIYLIFCYRIWTYFELIFKSRNVRQLKRLKTNQLQQSK
jgi:hypothetical protein